MYSSIDTDFQVYYGVVVSYNEFCVRENVFEGCVFDSSSGNIFLGNSRCQAAVSHAIGDTTMPFKFCCVVTH
jgi:hypothetical protein